MKLFVHMNIDDIISEHFHNDEVKKLNILSFYHSEIPLSTRKIVHIRSEAPSSFHNSYDVPTGGFYKSISLLLTSDDYKQIKG